jgi:putative ABC transport system permease protein
MSWIKRLLGRRRLYTDLSQEIREHLSEKIEELVASGMSREEATHAARREFGNAALIEERGREVWQWPSIESFVADVRYALRMLGKNPGFTAVAVLTLALGIGANTAIFSLFDAVMLRYLPVQKPEEVVLLQWHDPVRGNDDSRFSNPLWEQLRDRQDVFSGVLAAGWGQEDFDLAQGGQVQNVNGLYTSGSYFGVLGVRPAIGRLFNAADDRSGCPSLAVLSYGFWQTHFGGEPNAVGKVLSVNHHPFQIIGVSAPGFYGIEVGYKFDVAVPICVAPLVNIHRQLDHRSGMWLRVIGRMRPGLKRQQLDARLAVLAPQIAAGALPDNASLQERQDALRQVLLSVPAAAGLPDFGGQIKEPLRILMAVVSLVLLIACANVAGLMLARAVGRRREIAVRRALGASRARLIRQLLTECVLLSSAGALAGVLFARWGAALLVRYLSTAQHQVFLDLSLDGRVLVFTAAASVVTGVLFGILPALRSTRVSMSAAMKGSDVVEIERHRRFRVGNRIVSLQVALSLVLLVAASLLLASFEKLATMNIGFDRNDVLLVTVNLKDASVPPGQRPQTYEEIETRLRALPGVTSVGRSLNTPLSEVGWTDRIRSYPTIAPASHAVDTFFNAVSPEYIETLRMPLLAGRSFNHLDSKTSPPVAIVDQTVAHRLYPNVNPVGKFFWTTVLSGEPGSTVEIVGILQDSRYYSVRDDPLPTVFFPIAQMPAIDDPENLEIRTATAPLILEHLAKETIAGVNRGISIEFHTLTQQVNDSLVQERLLALLSGFFGALALLLAMVGLYGTFSYLVTQRRAEFGIRMCLGAQRGSILRLVMLDLIAVLAGGLVVGICVSLAATRVLQQMLFGLGPRDPLTLVAASGVLSAVALVAGYLPARRATKVDPMVALRYE